MKANQKYTLWQNEERKEAKSWKGIFLPTPSFGEIHSIGHGSLLAAYYGEGLQMVQLNSIFSANFSILFFKW
jgi:hypothetical protein